MSKRTARACMFGLLALVVVPPQSVQGSEVELETLIQRPIPNRFIKQGEIRVLKQDDAVIVQTILHTKYLDRIVEEIDKKEKEYWGDEHEASRSYVSRLQEAVAEAHALAARNGEEKRRLAINFIEDAKGTRTVFSMPKIVESEGRYAPVIGEPWQVLPCPRDYIRGNQDEIIDDAFGRKGRKIQKQVDANRDRIASER